MISLHGISPEDSSGRIVSETSGRHLGYGIPPDVSVSGQGSNVDDRHVLWAMREPLLPVPGQISSHKSGECLIYDSCLAGD